MKEAFVVMFYSPLIWVPIYGLCLWIKVDLPFSALMPDRRILVALGHSIQLLLEAQNQQGTASINTIIRTIIDKKIAIGHHVSFDGYYLPIHLLEIVGSLPFFEIDRSKFFISFDQLSCSICLEPWKNDEIVSDLLPCLHRFHRDCIKEWLEKHKNCPNCRGVPSLVLISPFGHEAP